MYPAFLDLMCVSDIDLEYSLVCFEVEDLNLSRTQLKDNLVLVERL
jgi:hypothetical protein